MKTCSKCRELKDESEFGKDKSKKDGRKYQCKACIRKYNPSHAKRKYGITVEEYHEKLATSVVCEVCDSASNLVYDHNHSTGEFRGVLCGKCNSALGLLQDSPKVLRSALQYLESRGAYGK